MSAPPLQLRGAFELWSPGGELIKSSPRDVIMAKLEISLVRVGARYICCLVSW